MLNIKHRLNIDLDKCIDSMLFDNGIEICHVEYRLNGKCVVVAIEVQGDYKLKYNDMIFNSASELPIYLKQQIEKYGIYSDGFEVIANNDFYLSVYNETDTFYNEPISEDLTKVNISDLFTELEDIAKYFLNN